MKCDNNKIKECEHRDGDECTRSNIVEPVKRDHAAEIDELKSKIAQIEIDLAIAEARATDIANLKQGAKDLCCLVNSLELRFANMEFDSSNIGQQFYKECAKAAMQGDIASTNPCINAGASARFSFEYADAMQAELERRKKV